MRAPARRAARPLPRRAEARARARRCGHSSDRDRRPPRRLGARRGPVEPHARARGAGREHGRRRRRPPRRRARRPRRRRCPSSPRVREPTERRDRPLESALDLGVLLASFAVTSPHTIHPDASPASLAAFARAHSLRLGPALARVLEPGGRRWRLRRWKRLATRDGSCGRSARRSWPSRRRSSVSTRWRSRPDGHETRAQEVLRARAAPAPARRRALRHRLSRALAPPVRPARPPLPRPPQPRRAPRRDGPRPQPAPERPRGHGAPRAASRGRRARGPASSAAADSTAAAAGT